MKAADYESLKRNMDGWFGVEARKADPTLVECITIEALAPSGRSIKSLEDLDNSTHVRLSFRPLTGRRQRHVLVERRAEDRARAAYEKETGFCAWCREGKTMTSFGVNGETWGECLACKGTGLAGGVR